MLDKLYNQKIIELAGNIPKVGHLDKFDAQARKHSKLCGSTVTVELCAEHDGSDWIVTDYAHQVRACALGQASSSIMASNVVGASFAELKQLQAAMVGMLKENGPPPSGRFEEYSCLEPVRDFKARHASTMLCIDAVVDCIEQLQSAALGAHSSGNDRASGMADA